MSVLSLTAVIKYAKMFPIHLNAHVSQAMRYSIKQLAGLSMVRDFVNVLFAIYICNFFDFVLLTPSFLNIHFN